MSAQEQNQKWTRRNVCAPLDLLHAFETGVLYDCTFRVGCNLQDPKSSYKDFKCHKVILSACSAVFEEFLFTSYFTKAKDKHIKMDKTDPEVFNSAMRFVYGAVLDLKSAAFGIEVYKFAYQTQINSLMIGGLTEYLNKNIEAAGIFAIFDLYKISGNQLGLEYCKEALGMNTRVALESNEWLNISSESVAEFLRLECLNVMEVELVRALIKWGTFQLERDGENLKNGKELRRTILPGLQLIRFESLTKEEFADLCMEQLGEVLSGDEKSSILLSFVTGQWKLPSAEISPSPLTPRRGPFTLCPAPFARNPTVDSNECSKRISQNLFFHVSKSAQFAGLKLNKTAKFHGTFWFVLYDDRRTKIGEGSSKVTFSNRGVEFCKITPICTLAPNVTYHLHIQLSRSRYLEAFTLTRALTQQINDGVTLSIKTTQLCAEVVALVFKN